MTNARRGQLYSLSAVLIVIPLAIFVIFYLETVQTIKFGSIDKIVSDQISQTSRSLEQDFDRAVQIIGKRAVLDVVNRIVTSNGTFVTDASTKLETLINNGTFDGSISVLLGDNTIIDWRNDVINIDTGFILFLNNTYIEIRNYDGFNLQADSNMTINISNKPDTIRINKLLEKHILVGVEGFEDPLIVIKTNGQIVRKIHKSPYPYYAKKILNKTTSAGNCTGTVTFNPSDPPAGKILVTNNASGVAGFTGVIGETADIPLVSCYLVNAANAVNITNNTIRTSNYTSIYLDESTGAWSLPINDVLEKDYYIAFNGPSGPDLLQRMEGSTAASTNGLESFISIPDWQAAGISIKPDTTVVDYLYLSDTPPVTCNKIRGLPSWFVLDDASRGKYNLTEISYGC